MNLLFEKTVWIGLAALTAIFPPLGALGLLLGYALADRTFSFFYMPVFSIPIFISEMVLGLMILNLCIRQPLLLKVKAIPWKSPWLWFVLLSLINLLRGLAESNFVLVVRDAAIAYYAVITWLALNYAKDKKAVYAIFWALLGGLIFQQMYRWEALWKDGEFISTPSTGMYCAILILGALCAYSQWKKWRWGLYAIFCYLFMTIAASEIRTVWVALLLAAAFATWGTWKLQINTKLPLRFALLAAMSMALLCIYYGLYHPANLKSLRKEVGSFYLGRDSPNVMTRIAMWEDAMESVFPPIAPVFRAFDRRVLDPWLGLSGENANLRYSLQNPTNYVPSKSGTAIIESVTLKIQNTPATMSSTTQAHADVQRSTTTSSATAAPPPKSHSWIKALIGVPFGEKFIPTRVSYVHKTDRYDPHNSIIALGYRLGSLGLLVFVVLIWLEMKKAYQFAKTTNDIQSKELVLACMTGVIYHLGHSLTDVTLENSFKGGILWLLLGLLMTLRREKEQSKAI